MLTERIDWTAEWDAAIRHAAELSSPKQPDRPSDHPDNLSPDELADLAVQAHINPAKRGSPLWVASFLVRTHSRSAVAIPRGAGEAFDACRHLIWNLEALDDEYRRRADLRTQYLPLYEPFIDVARSAFFEFCRPDELPGLLLGRIDVVPYLSRIAATLKPLADEEKRLRDSWAAPDSPVPALPAITSASSNRSKLKISKLTLAQAAIEELWKEHGTSLLTWKLDQLTTAVRKKGVACQRGTVCKTPWWIEGRKTARRANARGLEGGSARSE